jgi:predicted molibdopterin-dependent oxidoreductase YjgC
VVVQDIFLTETGRLADVVLPRPRWGEKTGTFTNADRTCTCLRRPWTPGEARADLDIFLDYAGRMDFRDRDGDRSSSGATRSPHSKRGSGVRPAGLVTTRL